MSSLLQAGASFLCGGLFSVGLLYSGMSNPAKVADFLDLFGNWDPSLMFVMAGAIVVAMPFFRKAVTTQQYTPDNKPIKLPQSTVIDRKLVLGSALFGIGWGLSGVCPAPALTLVSTGIDKSLIFVGSMLLGVILEGAIKTN